MSASIFRPVYSTYAPRLQTSGHWLLRLSNCATMQRPGILVLSYRGTSQVGSIYLYYQAHVSTWTLEPPSLANQPDSTFSLFAAPVLASLTYFLQQHDIAKYPERQVFPTASECVVVDLEVYAIRYLLQSDIEGLRERARVEEQPDGTCVIIETLVGDQPFDARRLSTLFGVTRRQHPFYYELGPDHVVTRLVKTVRHYHIQGAGMQLLRHEVQRRVEAHIARVVGSDHVTPTTIPGRLEVCRTCTQPHCPGLSLGFVGLAEVDTRTTISIADIYLRYTSQLRTTVQLLETRPDLSTFLALISRTPVSSTGASTFADLLYDESQLHIVRAPTNAAFARSGLELTNLAHVRACLHAHITLLTRQQYTAVRHDLRAIDVIASQQSSNGHLHTIEACAVLPPK